MIRQAHPTRTPTTSKRQRRTRDEHTNHHPAGADGQHAAAGSTSSRNEQPRTEEEPHERFLYVSTIAQSDSDPDFVAVIGADPEQSDFGEIVNRVDMPNVGDELHHFGYSADQQRLIVPGLFSNRIHVFDVDSDGSTMTLERGERGPRRPTAATPFPTA